MKKILKYIILLIIFIFFGCSKDNDEDEVIIEKSLATIVANSSSASEPANHSGFTIRLSKAVDENTTINLNIEGSAENGIDYVEIPSTITILANTLSVDIPVTIIDDSQPEEIELISVTLMNIDSSNVIIGALDSALLTLTNEAEEFLLSSSEAKFYVVNSNATPETVALFYNLKKVARTSFVVGQQDAFSSFFGNASGVSDMKKTTGFDPGVLGLDFMFVTDDENNGTPGNWFYNQELSIKGDAIEAYNKGMVNTFSWHMREPYEGEHFFTNNMTDFQKENALRSILPNGENHEYYKTKLDKIAEVARGLIGSDGKLIPIIFRPFHEFDGNWFWWGKDYCTPEEFITLWRFTIDYLKNVKGINNMLFAYASDRNFNSEAEYLERYPGDNYVDVLGMDNYGDFNNGMIGLNQVNNKLQIISKLAKDKVKVAGLTESCFFVTPGVNEPPAEFYSKVLYNVITENEIKLSYMMFWSNNRDSYCVPLNEHSIADDFIQFSSKINVFLQNDLPNMYQLSTNGI